MSDTEGEADIAKRATTLADELDADADEIEETLRNLVEYSVPVDEAERTVRRRYGTDSEPDASESKKIEELSPGDSRVSVEVKVLSAGKRSIRSNGDETTIIEGEVADETGKIGYTAWEDLGFDAGDTVRLEGTGVREWNGEPQVNMGDETRVSPADVESEYEAYDTAQLAELEEGDRAVDVEVRVIESEERVIHGRDGETSITSGVLGDSSGRLPFTDWENREFGEGASVRIENAYVNEFRGVPQVNMGEYTRVEELDNVEVSHAPPETTIADVVAKGGAFDVAVEGNVIQVKDGSGLVQRCPDCGRVIQKGQCRSHGDVEGETDMRTKAVIDDGTGALNLILGRELTEKVYGGSLEEAEDEAREAMDQGVVADTISDRIVGRRWYVRGNVSVGEYGANMEATEMDEASDDVAEEAKEVLDEFV